MLRGGWPNLQHITVEHRDTSTVCIYVWSVITYTVAEYGSTGGGYQSCSSSTEQGKYIFLCPRSRLRIRSQETGSAVPSRISPFILLDQAESDWLMLIVLTHGTPSAFRDGVQLNTVNGHRVSLEFIRSRNCVPMAFTARESAATGPVVLEVVPVTGAAFSGITMDQFSCAPLFPHPLYY